MNEIMNIHKNCGGEIHVTTRENNYNNSIEYHRCCDYCNQKITDGSEVHSLSHVIWETIYLNRGEINNGE